MSALSHFTILPEHGKIRLRCTRNACEFRVIDRHFTLAQLIRITRQHIHLIHPEEE